MITFRELGRQLLPPIVTRGIRKARTLNLFNRRNNTQKVLFDAPGHPVVRTFDDVSKTANAIEGMMGTFSMEVFDCLLSFQRETGTQGHIIEFGSFHGRSAAILASRMQSSERLILVDPDDQLDRATLSGIREFEFVKTSSEQFRDTFRDFDDIRNRCRFIHVDSSHFFSTTFRELQIAEDLIADRGVIALDDFANLHYSQIAAALYRYLYTANTTLCLFLVTHEKAYLCKRRDFQLYGSYILDRLCEEMSDRGRGTKYCLSRTNIEEGHRAFHIRTVWQDEEAGLYGYSIYRDFYDTP